MIREKNPQFALGKQDGISINDDISHKTRKFDGDPTIGSKFTRGEIILNGLRRVFSLLAKNLMKKKIRSSGTNYTPSR